MAKSNPRNRRVTRNRQPLIVLGNSGELRRKVTGVTRKITAFLACDRTCVGSNPSLAVGGMGPLRGPTPRFHRSNQTPRPHGARQ